LPDSCVEFLAFFGWLRPETASFLRVFAGNPRNTASKIIVLGSFSKSFIIILIEHIKNMELVKYSWW
jgi:hypothetical protein